MTYFKMVYKGHKGVNIPPLNFPIQDKPPTAGKFYLLIQKIIEINSKLEDLLKEKAEKETLYFQANLYALTKFIIYRNFYDSLPNDENAAKKFCEVVPSTQEDFLLKLIQDQKEWHKKLAETMADKIILGYATDKLSDKIKTSFNNASKEVIEELTKSLVENLKSSANFMKDQGLNPLRKPDNSTSNFVDEDIRADFLLEKRANTWKNRISNQPSSLMERFGFISCLYNNTFEITSQQMMLPSTNLVER